MGGLRSFKTAYIDRVTWSDSTCIGLQGFVSWTYFRLIGPYKQYLTLIMFIFQLNQTLGLLHIDCTLDYRKTKVKHKIRVDFFTMAKKFVYRFHAGLVNWVASGSAFVCCQEKMEEKF